ncbi:MAG TPA: hypothetical protein VFW07_09650 [Parafilimonas sp.]|nr:hypothetical protein [Parafilimonas sp.]
MQYLRGWGLFIQYLFGTSSIVVRSLFDLLDRRNNDHLPVIIRENMPAGVSQLSSFKYKCSDEWNIANPAAGKLKEIIIVDAAGWVI